MTAPPKFPPVTASPMEPGSRTWRVEVDNTKSPAHSWRVFAENLTESEARFIAAAVNHFGALTIALSERIEFSCLEVCDRPGMETWPDAHEPPCWKAREILIAARADTEDAE